MGLSDALNSSLSAIDMMGNAMGYVSSTLSNSQTDGFKYSDVMFSSVVVGANLSGLSGGGIRIYQAQNVDKQGSIAAGPNTSSLALKGEGMLIVSNHLTPDSNNDWHPSDILYTRTKRFNRDKDGNLVSPDGYYLLGWPMGTDGNIDKTNIANKMLGINVGNTSSPPNPTGNINLNANFNADAKVGDTFSFDQPIYDRLGRQHTITFTAVKEANNQWKLFAKPSGSEAFVQPGKTGTNITDAHTTGLDDGTGHISQEKITGLNQDNAQVVTTPDSKYGFDIGTINFAADGTVQNIIPDKIKGDPATTPATNGGIGVAGGVTAGQNPADNGKFQFILAPDGASDLSATGTSGALTSVTFDLGGIGKKNDSLTQFGGTQGTGTSASIAKGAGALRNLTNDGYGTGDFDSLIFDDKGNATIHYTNGQSITKYNIPIATFPNYNGLALASDNTYKATGTSGQMVPQQSGENGAATLQGGAIEQSTADSSKELGNAIQFQQTYSIATGISTKVKTMLDQLTQLARA